MAGELSGRILNWRGDAGYTSLEYSVAHGPSPGVIAITVPATGIEQFQLPEIPDLRITDGERDFTINGVRVVSQNRSTEGDGVVYNVMLHDRRWKWAYKQISGAYNTRDALGRIKKFSRVSVHRLAELCLEAMGEEDGSWDITDLPNPDPEPPGETEDDIASPLPQVDWELMPPAEALSQLAEHFGCRLVYQPIKDRVVIAKAGDGADLPEGSYTPSIARSRTSIAKPEILRFVGAPVAFTVALALEAVGEDLDGSIRPINDLSYKPSDGWGKAAAPHFAGVRIAKEWREKGKTLNDVRALANKCIYRWYRITTQPVHGDTFEVPSLDQYKDSVGDAFEVVDIEQIVLLDRIIGAFRDERKRLYVDAPRVYGKHWSGLETGNGTSAKPVEAGFTIDSERRLVIFNATIYKNNITDVSGIRTIVWEWETEEEAHSIMQTHDHGELHPAELKLLTSIHLLDQVTIQPLRYTRDRNFANGVPGTVQIVRRDDVQFANWVDYDPATWKIRKERDNFKEADKAAGHYLDAFDDFEDRVAEGRTYPRLMLTDPDGAIQSVTWRCAGAVSTTINRNDEKIRWMLPYAVRRGEERGKIAMRAIPLLAMGAVQVVPLPRKEITSTPTG